MKYQELLTNIKGIVDKDIPLVSNLSNISAILYKMDNLNWAGFYLVQGDTLYLGPFQGDVACTTIKIGRGVCGTSFKEKKAIVVPNVNEFPGHIACSELSKSEIVVPVMKNDEVALIIDLDSPIYSRFNNEELEFLLEVSKIIENLL